MIKLIATDMDGTLFYPKQRIRGIPDCNKKFLRRYLDNGGHLVCVSGRNGGIIPRVERQLHHKISLIGCNGAYFKQDGKTYDKYPMDRKKLAELFATFHRDFGVWLWMLFDEDDYLYCNTSNIPKWVELGFQYGNNMNLYFAEKLIRDDSLFLKRIAEHDNYKILMAFGLQEAGRRKAEQAAPSIISRFGDSFEVAVSGNAIEVTAKGINKGFGLENYIKANGYTKDEVLVCGDSGNDLYMFDCFPHSFAMAQSPDHFKSQANHVIKRISDLEDYLNHPEWLENDVIKRVNFQKALEKED